MTRDEREVLSQRICNFYHNSVKTTYLKYETTKDQPRNERPVKLSNKTMKIIVRYVNNRCGLSQYKMARRFQVHQSTISRNLQR
ncbi:unnamed protein product [Rotaria sordida]|uniref:Uncharacterized protein n=1 Tax=Rotaria sordida TaxID=392033 RepID=A0A820H8Z6_9BILA|nr:unnamed protein product [Rotaria sordida]